MRRATFISRACLWRFAKAALTGVTLVMVSSGSAAVAGEADHLKCYQVTKDTHLPKQAIVDLLNEQFGEEPDCTVQIKGAFFCAPTIKNGGDDPRGGALLSDFLCYRVTCAHRHKQAILIDDQFGPRQIDIQDARLLCTPTRKIIPPTQCGQTTVPQCGGICPAGDKCQPLATGHCGCK